MKQEVQEQELSTAEMTRVIDKLDEAQILSISFSGGEPFIRSDMLELLSYCIQKNFFKIGIFTNGTLLTDEHIRFLIDRRRYLSVVRMSVFSHDAGVHDGYCGVSNGLSKLIETGERLIAGGVTVLLLLNIIDINVESFEETKRFFQKKGFAISMGIRKLCTTPSLTAMLEPLTTQEFFLKIWGNMTESARNDLLGRFEKKIACDEQSRELCWGLSGSITVDYRGNLLPCVSLRKVVLGNILGERSILDILRSSEAYKAIRSVRKTDLEGCKDCRFINFCEPCLGMVYSQYGNYDHRPEQFCNYAKSLSAIGGRA
jgi:radical SAM protein with 4Fe4S-binding SPASM domain